MYLFGKTPALVLGTTAMVALGGAAPVPAIAAGLRASAADGSTPRPPHPPHRHHFAAPSLAAALVPASPIRAERAARETVGAAA